MNPYHLAVDIGASSGRLVLGRLEDGALRIEEVHRFRNGMLRKNGRLCWDVDALFEEILTGLEECGKRDRIPRTVGIDTWAVDFVLLDENGGRLGDSVAYRDSRTDGMDEVLRELVSEEEHYARTGIQKQPFNTVYQLLAVRQRQPELLRQAKGFLMIPEYFSYLLCGVGRHEYTNATTTALVGAHSKAWDFELIDRLKLPRGLFGPIAPPGTTLGPLLPEIRERVGFDCDVVLPCTHDTASAVVSAPIDAQSLYLSSGTWSLMGAELESPVCTEQSRRYNLTNEGGYGDSIRYLKNIMGLWIIQRVREELGGYSFDDLCDAAKREAGFPSRIDVNASRFLAPDNMMEEVKRTLAESGWQVPETTGQLMYCIYTSLAESYGRTVRELEELTGKRYSRVCIVGGGCKDTYLNELAASACSRTVTAGPVEGTATGNLLIQMIAGGELSGLAQAREVVRKSFSITIYKGGRNDV